MNGQPWYLNLFNQELIKDLEGVIEEQKNYPPYLDYPKPRKPMTNADRIRAMSDEELAHELALVASWKRSEFAKAKKNGLEAFMMSWLKKPAMGDE